MDLYWTWTKIRLSYLANKGIRYGVVLTNQIITPPSSLDGLEEFRE